MRNRLLALVILASAFLAGCASPYKDLPIRRGTVIEAQPSLRMVYHPNANGAAVGALLGGVVGHQIGNGSGRKIATTLGVLSGATVGAATGRREMVPFTMLRFRDDTSGEMYDAEIDGAWQPGMAIRYSLTADGMLVLR